MKTFEVKVRVEIRGIDPPPVQGQPPVVTFMQVSEGAGSGTSAVQAFEAALRQGVGEILSGLGEPKLVEPVRFPVS